MTSRRFFSFALLLPLVMPVVGALVPKLDGFIFLFAFGGVPYVPVAIVLWLLIRRARSMRRLVTLAVAAPFAYGLALAISFLIVGGTSPSVGSIAEVVVMGAVYSAPFVIAAWLLWAAARWASLVQNEFAT